MVGVINGANNTSVDQQIALAKAAPFQLGPGQSLPNSSNNTSKPEHKSGLSGGAIGGIVVGAVVLILLIAAITYLLGRNKAQGEQLKRHSHLPLDSEGPKTGSVETTPNMQHYSLNSQAHPAWTPGDHTSPLVSPQPGQTFEGRYHPQTPYHSAYPNGGNGPVSPNMGTFVGYNRQTGLPEYAQEAPTGDAEVSFSSNGSRTAGANETHELPGDIQHRDVKSA
jgi:hypothetical protein